MMNEIVINNNITEEPCLLYGPNDELVGKIENRLAFYDVRVNIAKKKLSGYYIVFKGKKYKMDFLGHFDEDPKNLFKKDLDYSAELINEWREYGDNVRKS